VTDTQTDTVTESQSVHGWWLQLSSAQLYTGCMQCSVM